MLKRATLGAHTSSCTHIPFFRQVGWERGGTAVCLLPCHFYSTTRPTVGVCPQSLPIYLKRLSLLRPPSSGSSPNASRRRPSNDRSVSQLGVLVWRGKSLKKRAPEAARSVGSRPVQVATKIPLWYWLTSPSRALNSLNTVPIDLQFFLKPRDD